ncbi:hypothetical protein [Actinomadura sp. 7K534]|uniref:WD40/YVTN/BNR-like repeat-containing protein n=1 Tax=Actinomadura sp. 7K534 TaxID=2530366 RepID=UPI001042FF3A|nr:hypothetical protein [Actinomadura sp. 7K534]TDB94935.1 hypothetical protein E1266_14955 [Actinomadura sp. 7K534]
MTRSLMCLALAATVLVSGVFGTARAAATGWGPVALPFLWPEAGLGEVAPDGAGGVWVGGHQGAYCVPDFIGNCIAQSRGNPVVRRWTGTSWAEYPITGWTGEGSINRIAVAADETWIAGIAIGPSPDFVARFDGTAFGKVDLPAALQLEAVGTGQAGAWIAGYTDEPQRVHRLYRRTGSAWTAVDLPDGMRRIDDLRAARDGTGMWAIGNGTSAVLAAARFDGTSWTSLPTPPGLGGFGRVVPVAEDDVWATTGTVAVHWDGAAWTAVPFPDDYPRGILEDIAVDASGTVWVTDGGDILHRYRDGEWTSVKLGPYGTMLQAVTEVPGTNTVWTVGADGRNALAFKNP